MPEVWREVAIQAEYSFVQDNNIGPNGVRALPLAAGINEGGHYFRYFCPSGVRALPLAAGINEGGHYFRYLLFLGAHAKIWNPTTTPSVVLNSGGKKTTPRKQRKKYLK